MVMRKALTTIGYITALFRTAISTSVAFPPLFCMLPPPSPPSPPFSLSLSTSSSSSSIANTLDTSYDRMIAGAAASWKLMARFRLRLAYRIAV